MIRCKNNRTAAWMRRALALVLAMLMLCGISVSAADLEQVPYYSYCYWEGPSRYEAVPMRSMYEADMQITGVSLGVEDLSAPRFVTLSQDGKELYIMDGVSRILVVDTATNTLIRQIGEIQSADGPLAYHTADNNGGGLYVAANGNLYIADSGNKRVLIADTSANLIRVLEKPTGNGIPEDLDFTPSRVMMDEKGYLYVVCSGCPYGMLVFDTEYNFLGFHGSYKVETTVLESLGKLIEDLFMTNEKAEVSRGTTVAEILDISIDPDGLLYTLSGTGYGQIKRLGLNGNQTLNHKFGFTSQSGDLVNFNENPASFTFMHMPYSTSLTAITVDPEGFVYMLDAGNRGRIFMYDEECRAISVFSSGLNAGEQVGTLYTAKSFACSSDKMYVLDFKTNAVTIFNLTEYGKLYKQANILTIAGEYDTALPMWEEVLKLDANNQRGYEGIGKAMLQQADAAMNAAERIEDETQRKAAIEEAKALYHKTMEYAELGNDQQTYSQAFEVVQKDWLTNNFWWLFLVCLAAVGGIAALLVISKKRKVFEIKNVKVKTALSVPIHPIEAFNALKYQNTASVPLAILFVVVFYLATVSEDLFGGFMYVITDKTTYNSLFTLIGSVGILLLWVIVNWGICILNEGKGSLKEVFTMSAYSMAPLIVYSVIYTVASHVIPSTGESAFTILSTIMFIYTALLLLLGMTVVHEYTFFKAMGMAVLVILCMLLAAFVIFSVVLLSQQFITFIVNIIDEIALR